MKINKVTKFEISMSQEEVYDLFKAIEVVYGEFVKKSEKDPLKNIKALVDFKDKLVLSYQND